MNRRLLFFLFTLSFSLSLSAAELKVQGSEHLTSALTDVLRLLPPDFLNAVKGVVTVTPKSFETDQEITPENFCRLDGKISLGHKRRNTIFISKKLIDLSESYQGIFACQHRTFDRLLKAVLIHEISHLKDRAESISSDRDFKRIVGVKRNTRFSRKIINQNSVVSPNSQEFEDLEEAFAVNMEYLILDPEFQCRKPATAEFLAKKAGLKLQNICQKNYEVIVQSAYPEDNYSSKSNIDPERIFQVHYLFAGKGNEAMSRWGHAMFRLVVCSPFRKTVGPDCLMDVSHHIVLSYRAYMSDVKLSYSKGLFGGYPSQMFIFRYLEIVQEYTKHELRDLYSVPLKLDQGQKKEFLELAVERYWTYEGKYYFLDNNCGTEAVKHLTMALGDDEAKLVGSLTPLKIYNDLKKNSDRLVDRDLNRSRQDLIREGVLIESLDASLTESFLILKRFFPSFQFNDVDSFLNQSRAQHRHQDYLNSFNMIEDSQEKKRVILHAVFVERYMAGRLMKKFFKEILNRMNKDKDLKLKVAELSKGVHALTLKPWDIIKSSYGVPTKEELSHLDYFNSEREARLQSALLAQLEKLQTILSRDDFGELFEELTMMKKIKTLLDENIHELAKPIGGTND